MIGPEFNSEAFRKDFPIVIASSRATALMQPMRLKYDSGGYLAGQTMARNSTSTLYTKYVNGGSSGTGVATSFLFEDVPVEAFDSATGTAYAVGIFGQCLVFKGNLIDYDSDAGDDLGARDIIDATGVTLVKF